MGERNFSCETSIQLEKCHHLHTGQGRVLLHNARGGHGAVQGLHTHHGVVPLHVHPRHRGPARRPRVVDLPPHSQQGPAVHQGERWQRQAEVEVGGSLGGIYGLGFNGRSLLCGHTSHFQPGPVPQEEEEEVVAREIWTGQRPSVLV